MSTKEITKQVQKAFVDDETRKFAKDYLEALRFNMQTTEKKFQSSILLIFFLFGIFVLLAEVTIIEAAIGPFKLKDPILIHNLLLLLPFVIAYSYYELISQGTMRRLYIEVHNTIMEEIYKPIIDEDLGYYLLSPSSLVTETIFVQAAEDSLKKINKGLAIPSGVIIIFFPIVFELYAFYECLSTFGFANILVWIVIVFSAYFLLRGALFYQQTINLVGG